MPRVPLPQVGLQTSPSPAVEAPGSVGPIDVGSRAVTQFGAAMSEFGTGVAQAARAMQDEIDDAKVTDAYTKWADASSETVAGYLNTVGADSLGYNRAKALGLVEKSWREIERGLQNETQRGMFHEAVQRHMIGVKERVYGHEAEQLRVTSIGKADAMRIQAATAAADGFLDRSLTPAAKMAAAAAEALATGDLPPEGAREPGLGTGLLVAPQEPQKKADEFTVQRNTAIDQANRVADLKGWKKDDPRREALILETTTIMHARVVDGLLARGFTQQAKDYVAKLDAKEVQGPKLDEMLAVTRRAAANDVGAQLASDTVAAIDQAIMPQLAKEQGRRVYAYEVFGGTSFQAGVDAIEKQFRAGKIDVDARRVALTELEAAHNRRRQVWMDQSRSAVEQAEKLFAENRNLTLDSAEFPPQLLADLKRFGKVDEASRLQGGATVVTTPRAYAELMAAKDSGRLRGMSNSELFHEFHSKLGGREWAEAQEAHAEANQALKEPKKTTIFTDTDRLKLVATKAKIIESAAGPKGDDEELRMLQFKQELQKRVDIEQAKTGKPVDDDRLQAIADGIAIEAKVAIPDWATDTTKWEFELTPEEEAEAYRTEWGEEIRIAKGKGPAVRYMLKEFEARGIPTPSTSQLGWLSRIPKEELTRVLDALQASGVKITPERIRAGWLQFFAPKPAQTTEPYVPRWRVSGYGGYK